MDVTPNYGWEIPVEYSQPWYLAIRDMINSIDATVKSVESGATLQKAYDNGQTVNLTGNAMVFTTTANPVVMQVAGAPFIVQDLANISTFRLNYNGPTAGLSLHSNGLKNIGLFAVENIVLNSSTGSASLQGESAELLGGATGAYVEAGAGPVSIGTVHASALNIGRAGATTSLFGGGGSMVLSATGLDASGFANIALTSLGNLRMKDSYLTAAVPLSQPGQAALTTTAQSIVGAINELKSRALQALYDNLQMVVVSTTPLGFQTNGMAPWQVRSQTGVPRLQVIDTGPTTAQTIVYGDVVTLSSDGELTLDDGNTPSPIKLADSSNTEFTTTNKTVLGAVNEVNAATGVTPGSYTNASITVNSKGRITAASSGSSSGEANTASNLGSTGEGLFASKVGVDLQFKKLKAGTNVALSSDSESITVSASGGGVYEQWLQAGNLAQVSSTVGNYYKTPKTNENSNNGWAQPIANTSDSYVNGAVDPFYIPETGKLTELRLAFSAAAVGGGTVGASPAVQLVFYKVNSTHSGYDTLATVNVPISATGVGIYNNLGTASPQNVSYNMTDISVSAGDLVGWRFVNQSGENWINSISRSMVSVHFVADA